MGLVLVSIYTIGKKKSIGWIISIVSNVLYIPICIQKGLNGILVMQVSLAVISTINWLDWRKQGL